jgi:large subunit ribosomal protein L13
MKTYSPSSTDIKRNWLLVDIAGKILGREASQIAQWLIGKHKVYYVPHLDCGDYVVVINADKVRLTGKKEQQKKYARHSGYPGGLKEVSFAQQMSKDPRKIIESAVSRMLPKNKLHQKRLRRLKVFAGGTHPYQDKLK